MFETKKHPERLRKYVQPVCSNMGHSRLPVMSDENDTGQYKDTQVNRASKDLMHPISPPSTPPLCPSPVIRRQSQQRLESWLATLRLFAPTPLHPPPLHWGPSENTARIQLCLLSTPAILATNKTDLSRNVKFEFLELVEELGGNGCRREAACFDNISRV